MRSWYTCFSKQGKANRKGFAMSIDCWNRNECKRAFLNAKNCISTAERQESTREFCVALWYNTNHDNADSQMINRVVLYLTNCARVCTDEHDFELIANGMRNAYYDGVDQGIIDSEDHWRSKGYSEGYEDGFNTAMDEERE